MSEELSEKARALALALWQEQYHLGIGDEPPSESRLGEWLSNRCYPIARLEEAAQGDVAALMEVRLEAGLPPFV